MALRVAAAICSVAILLVHPPATICRTKNARISKAARKAARKNVTDAADRAKRRRVILAMHAKRPIVGAASMYNPFRPGKQSGGAETASGERYDPSAWTAAIRTDLRDRFGGVHYGKEYEPAFALVESGDKQAIIKINDVGPLKPGRVIDFNERTMRYFDPTLRRGLIANIKVIPLTGSGWTAGPVYG